MMPPPSSANRPSSSARATRASSAMTARIAARPKASRRFSDTAARGPGPRSPETWSSTAGRPPRAASPCSETVSGSARRAHWPIAREPPACAPTSRRTALSSVRRSPIGAASRSLDQGTIQGLWMRRLARSPSTIAASIGSPAALSANACAPAPPRAAARGRDEHERRGEVAHLEHARELEQRRRARQLGERGRAARVAMRHHDDPPARQPGPHADDRLELGRPVDRAPALRAAADPEAAGAERLGDAVRERAIGVRARRALGERRRRAPAASRTRASR